MPRFWRRLRWQLIAAQLVVVAVGVVVLIGAADVLATRAIAPELLPAVQVAITKALIIAAVAAATVGLGTSLLLLREILRPLHEVAHSSQRIASGRYDERVEVPATEELGALASSFNQMAEVLETVEHQRILLIGNVAHELRTPLAGLEGYLEGLVDGVFPSTPETFTEMQHEVRRLRRLVDDLQTLSRVESGQVQLTFSDFDLGELAGWVLVRLQPQLIDGHLGISFMPPATPVRVYADPDRTAQILLNLLGNAIRYTPEGGTISVSLRQDQDQAQLQVCDTGIGIPADALPYIFERFYRVDPSRSRSSGGSGIGLTIAQHLAWAMAGDIVAESAGPGQGSCFTVTLPLAE